jgi:hypothetical protein
MDNNTDNKVWKQLFRESWFSITILVISALFTSGMTYAKVRTEIIQNQLNIETVNKNLEDFKVNQIEQHHDDRIDINQRLDTIESKIDEINRYLRARVK